MDISTLYTRYKAGTIDPNWYQKLLDIKKEFDKQHHTVRAIWERAQRERQSPFWVSQEVGKLFEPLLDKYLKQVEKLIGRRDMANAFVREWIGNASHLPEGNVSITPAFSQKYEKRMVSEVGHYLYKLGQEKANQIREIANLSLRPVSAPSSNPQSQQQITELQQQIAKMQEELQRTRSAPPTQPSQPQQVGDNWELPEEGLLQTGEFATQLAKQRQQQDANLLASGLTRQQILQQRGSENIVRELGLSKMIAEQRRKSIQDWLQTVGGLQQQVRPPDFTGLREMASAFQQGTSAQQQMMMKLFENLMKQGGSS